MQQEYFPSFNKSKSRHLFLHLFFFSSPITGLE